MKLLMVVAAIWFSIGTINSLTYPIFGTKRYNRGLAPQRSDMTQNILKQPAYEHGYLTNNGYYYYPHHEYHSYGMPTYRGEYKPKTYYYSSGPSYNYYNDRESLSNPLDDLHEEILQENEQERQTDLLQRDDYEDDYYIEDPNEKIHDEETTNNFLRNMMEYNRQREKQQRLQQLHYRQRDQLDQELQGEKDEHSIADDDYFSEVNPDDYQFEPQGEDNFDLKKYWDAELSSMNKGASSTDFHYREEPDLTRLNNDQDVEELKSLSKHDRENYEEDNKKRYHNKVKQPSFNSWTHPKPSDTASFPQQQKDFEDDYSAVDYDDGSWINWDRKRSSPSAQKKIHRMKTIEFKAEPEIESHKSFIYTSNNKRSFFPNEPTMSTSESTSVRSTTLPSTAYGQKEKYPLDESNAAMILDQKNEENSNKKFSKSAMGMENTIYDTIKKMITIEQELKKKRSRSKMQKRNTNDAGSVVNQLDSLKKHTN
ncbi:protein KRI1 homolog [Eupeodes corollae]|uniref:protein KRI1 homolog n=1 Tax=Eupeodes corollae TaxID=290404 RepID=UPI002490B5B1|nr:protein KRI1 homolog [Eupeodes corollae]